MNSFELDEYLRKNAEYERELDTWKKVSWGIFIGSSVMAMLLGKWSTQNSFGDPVPLIGEAIATWLAGILLGAYYWRRKVLDKRLEFFYRAIPKEEQRKLIMGEYKNNPKH